jgi:4-amino-4-deoxy-L-arabinose transferase-like glycosyltransferase
MADLGILAVVLVIALGAGRRLLAAVPFEWALEEGLFAIALGLGLLAYATLALAEAGLLGRPGLIVVLGAATVFGWREIVAGIARALHGARRWWHASPSRSERAAVVLGAILIAAELVTAFAPPVGGDQTKYQLVYPRLWAEAHRVVATPWSFWGYFQYLMNLLFAAAFVLRGDVLARLLNCAYGVLLAFAVFALGRRAGSRQTGVWAALLFVTMPLTASLMSRAWVEFALTLYVVLAVIAVLAWRRSASQAWLALAALMAGFAAGTKVIGLLVPAILGVVVVVDVLRRDGLRATRAALVTVVTFGLIAALVASPCYLRNAVETGNPIYPFGYGVFGGRNWSADAARGLDAYYAAYRETQAGRRGSHAYHGMQALRFPWDLTMAPQSFEEIGRSAYDVGPFLLAFVPGLLLLRRASQARLLAAVAIAYAVVVVFGIWAHPRYVHPALILLLVVAVEVTAALREYGAWAPRAVTALLAATVLVQTALSLRVIAPLWPDSARVALGRMTPDAFLRRNDRRYALASLVHAQVPPDGHLLVLGMIPHPYYYVGRSFVLASPLEQGAIDYWRMQTVDEFVAAIRRLGITHVVRETEPDKPAVNPVGDRVLRMWDALLARSEKVGDSDGGALYRLAPDLARAEGGA